MMLEDQTGIAPADANGSDGAGGLTTIAGLLRGLHRAEATGELAELRRMDTDATPPAAFFRLIARAGFAEMSNPENIRRWVATVRVMAQRPDALRTDVSLGEALHRIGVSEPRLDMLLSARGRTLFDIVRRLSLRLARSEEAMPYHDLCRLLLWSDRPDKEVRAEQVRIYIAQSYVRAARRKSGAADNKQ